MRRLCHAGRWSGRLARRSAARGAGCWPVFTFCNAATAFQREGRGARGRPLPSRARPAQPRRDATRSAVCGRCRGGARSAAFQPGGAARQLCPYRLSVHISPRRSRPAGRGFESGPPALTASSARHCTAADAVLNSSWAGCHCFRLSAPSCHAWPWSGPGLALAWPRPSRRNGRSSLGPLSRGSAGYLETCNVISFKGLHSHCPVFFRFPSVCQPEQRHSAPWRLAPGGPSGPRIGHLLLPGRGGRGPGRRPRGIRRGALGVPVARRAHGRPRPA